MTEEQLRDAVSRFEAKRLEAKPLMLSCQRCGEYFQCGHWERFCIHCRPTAGSVR
jgi:Zn finger protein HypA/HybF involved in hydrogenase expression